jgi:hypothetical protein
MQVFKKPKERADAGLPPGSFVQALRPIEGCVAMVRTQHNLTNERSIIAVRNRDAVDGTYSELKNPCGLEQDQEVLPSYGQILPATSEVGTAGVVSCAPASALL